MKLFFRKEFRRVEERLTQTGMNRKTSSKEIFRLLLKNSLVNLLALFGKDYPVEIRGLENLDFARQSGQSLLFFSIHMGAFELLLPSLIRLGLPCHVPNAENGPKWRDSLLTHLRGRKGHHSTSSKNFIKKIPQVLKKKEAMALLIDQGKGGKDTVISLLGKPCTFHIEALQLARKRAAILLPFHTWRKKNGDHVVEFHPSLNPQDDLTQGVEVFVNEILNRHPAQWVWHYGEHWK